MGYAGRSLQSDSDRVGNSNINAKNRAASDGFGSFSKNVREYPKPVNRQPTASGRDVFDDVDDDITIDMDSHGASIDARRPSVESAQNVQLASH